MAEEKPTETTETTDEGISEDDLRSMIGEELDKRFENFSESMGGIVDGIFNRLKGEAPTNENSEVVSEDSLLEKIGSMIDDKLAGFKGSANGEKQPREPKLRIFS